MNIGFHISTFKGFNLVGWLLAQIFFRFCFLIQRKLIIMQGKLVVMQANSIH
jgi:hypothetical protein